LGDRTLLRSVISGGALVQLLSQEPISISKKSKTIKPDNTGI
jgi:hypothetical protein